MTPPYRIGSRAEAKCSSSFAYFPDFHAIRPYFSLANFLGDLLGTFLQKIATPFMRQLPQKVAGRVADPYH